jgi:plastocyanin
MGGWPAALLLAFSCVVSTRSATAPAPAGGPAAAVTGTVKVELATFRTEGPKHDRDVVVMLDPVKGAEAAPAAGRAKMDQRGLVFIPHVLAIQKGSTVTFLNNDHEQHNVYFMDERTGKTLDIGTYGPGISTNYQFLTPGPVIVLCKLHLEMAAYIVVAASPWFTVAELDPATRMASFSIKDVPPGDYQLTVWHKKLKQVGGPAAIVVPPVGKVEHASVLTTASRAKKGR